MALDVQGGVPSSGAAAPAPKAVVRISFRHSTQGPIPLTSFTCASPGTRLPNRVGVPLSSLSKYEDTVRHPRVRHVLSILRQFVIVVLCPLIPPSVAA